MENKYKVLSQQVFSNGDYSIVPIRMEDRYEIMKWRNEQMYHLRQNEPLIKEEQDNYFSNTISNLFEAETPNQILFSYTKENTCIGYGGLVHINWVDKNAELSFIMDTEIEGTSFEKHWCIFINLIEKVAFLDLKFNKIFTYAFDLRPHLYSVLVRNGFEEEARLKEHCLFDSIYRDVVIHAKYKNKIQFRVAEIDDLTVTYTWASSPIVREYALSKGIIPFEEHKNWFVNKIADNNAFFLIATIESTPIGLVRFDGLSHQQVTISYLLDPGYHGKGLGKQLLSRGLSKLYRERGNITVTGLVHINNIASRRIFEQLCFHQIHESEVLLRFTKQL